MNSKIIRIAVSAICLTLLINGSFAQRTTPSASSTATTDRVALHQALLDLTNPWTVMCIAAHPDDEDETSLIVMRRKYGAHTVSLFSTFGEGGQNAIGPELYEELGAIRVRETMVASEMQGSEPHFLGLKDFGYSKSADEAFRFWGHDEALRRMVFQIRKLRPDVIITNHSATSNDHGHHQATARLELEAFEAAADPKRFPEQLKGGVTVWQVQRLFVSAGRSQPAAAAGQKPDREGGLDSIVTIDPNERDPIRGTTYAEEALRALQKHATQGPWPRTVADMARFRNSADGKLPLIRYRLVRYAKDSAITTIPPAFDIGLDSHNFLDGLRLPEEFAKQLAVPMINGHPLADSLDNRPLVFQQLVALRQNYNNLMRQINTQRFLFMRQRVERALALAAGVTLTVAPSILGTPNSTVDLPLRISNSGTQTVEVLRCLPCAAGSICIDDGPVTPSKLNQAVTRKGIIEVDSLMPGAVLNRTERLFQVPAKMPANTPLSSHLYEPNALGIEMVTTCSFQLANVRVNFQAATRLIVAPSVEIENIKPSALVITPQTRTASKPLTLQVINHEKTNVRTAIETIALSSGAEPAKRVRIAQTPLTLAPNERREVKITLPTESKTVTAMIRTPIRRTVLKPTQTPPAINDPLPLAPAPGLLFRTTDNAANEVAVPMVYADARVAPNTSVGYVRGFDYSLPNALAALGVESNELSANDVKTADLQKYSTIIVDNRVYESQPELIATNQRLLDYAKDGGTLIVFYHKWNEWNPDERRKRPRLAPYKLVLGNERITDETAPVTFIEPQHPLLNIPNKLGQEDFANWIQERGLYYPKDWDPQFHALLQSNDPGEQPLRGGLLVAEYGRGHYIYSSMVWYRQLRAGGPGAYRMLANMISYGRPPR